MIVGSPKWQLVAAVVGSMRWVSRGGGRSQLPFSSSGNDSTHSLPPPSHMPCAANLRSHVGAATLCRGHISQDAKSGLGNWWRVSRTC